MLKIVHLKNEIPVALVTFILLDTATRQAGGKGIAVSAVIYK